MSRILGIDSSSSLAGHTLLVNKKLKDTYIWKPKDKKANQLEKLIDYYTYLNDLLTKTKPDGIIFEELAMARNMNTVKVLRRIEGVIIVVAYRHRKPLKEVRVSSARMHVLGNGRIDKEEAYRIVTEELEPDYDWLPGTKASGGLDEVDSYVVAKAYPFV